MKSYERRTDEQNTYWYGDFKQPRYNILTYTWGRWEVPHAPTIRVEGLTWKIPSVSPDHFTVEQFERVIERVCQTADFVWIDVACIDQEQADVKAYQIDQQIGIFNGANEAFVWLSGSETEKLQLYLDDFFAGAFELYDAVHAPADASPPTAAENERVFACSEKLRACLQALFQDPWFSSLWTLQESVLRRDALILSSSAKSIDLGLDHTDGKVHLGIFINACSNVFTDVHNYCHWRLFLSPHERIGIEPVEQGLQSSIDDSALNDLKMIIENKGFHFYRSSNPNVQYAAAQHRQCRERKDRIIAIMQIYNLQLGRFMKATDYLSMTFDELEVEFAIALNTRCPVLGQMFIHLQEPDYGRSWRMTQHSQVPDRLLQYYGAQALCTVSFTSTAAAKLAGKACSLSSLVSVWRRRTRDPVMQIDAGRIMLDRASWYARSKSRFPYDPSGYRCMGYGITIGTTINDFFGEENVRCLHLGVVGFHGNPELESPLSAEKSQIMILLVKIIGEGSIGWRRIGICEWWAEIGNSRSNIDLGPLWTDFEGDFL